MPSAFNTITWETAFDEFLLHNKATRAVKTYRFYDVQLRQLIRWANENQIAFDRFGKRALDRYPAFRLDSGKARMTLHHDAVAVKAFFRGGRGCAGGAAFREGFRASGRGFCPGLAFESVADEYLHTSARQSTRHGTSPVTPTRVATSPSVHIYALIQ